MNHFVTSLIRRNVCIPAYAKINLTLEVLGTRPDGYHAIRSIIVPIELHDDVEISVADGNSISASSDVSLDVISENIDISALGSPEKNLAVRAARLFLARLDAKKEQFASLRVNELASLSASSNSQDCQLTDSLTHQLATSQTRKLANSQTHQLANSLTHQLTDSLTHQLTNSQTRKLANSQTDAGLSLRITKRIPLGGGLGGGSADCAATLRGLNSMFEQPPFSTEELISMAAELGSDIPAMVLGGTVLMEGRGEKVTAVKTAEGKSPLPSFNIVLANPGIHVSTPEAYRLLDTLQESDKHNSLRATAMPGALGLKGVDNIEPRRPDAQMPRCPAQVSPFADLTSTSFLDNILHSPNCGKGVSSYAAWLFNGLERAVFALRPEIERLAGRLKDAGSEGVLMSGSGATVFALADDVGSAERIMRSVSAECWCMVTRTLPDGVMAAHGPLEA